MKAMVLTKPRGPLLFLMNLTYAPGSLTVLGPGAVLVIKGRTDIATLITFLSATGKIVDPWNAVVDWARAVAATTVRYRLLAQALAEPITAGVPG